MDLRPADIADARAVGLVLRHEAATITAVKTNTISRIKHVVAGAVAVCAFLQMLTAATVSAADSKPGVALKQIATGFVSPLNLLTLDDGSGRLLIADQVGTVHILNANGALADKLFLDLRARMTKLNQGFDERGLLGLALHPRFKQNRKLYAFYSAPLCKDGPEGWDHTAIVSEFKVSEKQRDEVDAASERVLMQIDKPYFNHSSGRIVFGPDGFLYIGVGDGGNANDTGRGHSPQGNGQDLTTVLGKILRIDVDKTDKDRAYAIPSDNPFIGGKGRPEIFAYGLRNPWGISFDRGGRRELFATDVGQTLYEELNLIVKGGNYGWNIREGSVCFDPKNPKTPLAECAKVGADGQPLIDPIAAYKNVNGFRNDPEARGISSTGGYVYRGKALPELAGRYVFADWSRNWAVADGVLFAVKRPMGGAKNWMLETLEVAGLPKGKLGAYIVAMGEDADGELYVLTNGSNALMGKTGKVFKLVKAE